MRDSTPFIDANGVRRDRPLLPERHACDPAVLDALLPIAEIGAPDSAERRGWLVLLRVHGYSAVLQATARCYQRLSEHGRVRNAQAQVVLDGRRDSPREPEADVPRSRGRRGLDP